MARRIRSAMGCPAGIFRKRTMMRRASKAGDDAFDIH